MIIYIGGGPGYETTINRENVMYWTIQQSSVLDEIGRTGVYYPDFRTSEIRYPGLYTFALRYFRMVNGDYYGLKGVVFTFDDTLDEPLRTLKDVEDFLKVDERREAIRKGHLPAIYDPGRYCLICLDNYPSYLRTLPMDMMFFCLLKDYMGADGVITDSRPDSRWMMNWLEMALMSWVEEELPGWSARSDIGINNIMQRCVPFIRKDNIVSVHSMNEIIRAIS